MDKKTEQSRMELEDARDKKFEAILDGVHAFFTGAAALQITHNFGDPVHVMLVKKP